MEKLALSDYTDFPISIVYLRKSLSLQAESIASV